MAHFSGAEVMYMEALKKQRVIDRKHEALERLAKQKDRESRAASSLEINRTQNDAHERLASRCGTSTDGRRPFTTGHENYGRIYNQVFQSSPVETPWNRKYRYEELVPQQPLPPRQWRDFQRNLRHDAVLFPKDFTHYSYAYRK